MLIILGLFIITIISTVTELDDSIGSLTLFIILLILIIYSIIQIIKSSKSHGFKGALIMFFISSPIAIGFMSFIREISDINIVEPSREIPYVEFFIWILGIQLFFAFIGFIIGAIMGFIIRKIKSPKNNNPSKDL